MSSSAPRATGPTAPATSSPVRPVVLVPVKGTETGDALLVAVREARRLGAGLHLLHVVPPPPAEAYVAYLDLGPSLVAAAEEIMRTAAATVRRHVDDAVPVTTEVAHLEHPAAAILARAGAPCVLVVMPTTRRGRMSRIFTGSTTAAVAARCPVPLVVVPAGCSTSAVDPTRVVVGLHDPEQSPEVLAVALRRARSRGTGLLVLHAWCLDDAYAGMPTDDDRAEAQFRRTRDALRSRLAPALAAFPEVAVEVQVTEGPPVEALVAASAGAGTDVLVVGRHRSVDPDHPHRGHLGSVARAVVQHAACPVLVVDPSVPEDRSDGLDATARPADHLVPSAGPA